MSLVTLQLYVEDTNLPQDAFDCHTPVACKEEDEPFTVTGRSRPGLSFGVVEVLASSVFSLRERLLDGVDLVALPVRVDL